MANPKAAKDLARIDAIISELYQMADRPGLRPQTSNQLRLREQSRRQTATAIRINGLEVREDYR